MKTPTVEQLRAENAELRARLEEAEQTLDAIRGGEVDALVVSGPKGEQIFSLVGAESIYRLIVETMKDAAFTVAFDGTILFCNAQFGRFVQRPMEQIVGHRLHEFVAPDNLTSADSLLLLSGKQPVKQRLVLWNSQEQPVPVHISANALNQPDGPSICIVATDLTDLENSTDLIQQLRRQQQALRDSRIAALNLMKDAVETRQQTEQANENLRQEIIERESTEEALRESEGRFRALTETSSLAVGVSSAEGKFLYLNKAYEELLGYTLKELNHLNASELWRNPEDRRKMIDAVRSEGLLMDYEVELKRKDGTPFWATLSVNSVDYGGNQAIMASVYDITDRKQAEEALRELNTTLESKVAARTAELEHRARQLQKLTLELSETEDRERRQLAEILHDDLQQQLAAAKFQLSLLNSRAKHDPAQLAIVTRVDQMLMEAVQKSRSLSHELSPAVLYQGDFAGALTWLAGRLQAKHGLEVAVDAFGEVNVPSDALKSFLYKAAQELLFNVVKHARVNRAWIRVRRLRHWICLSVSDLGRGFDPQNLRQTQGFGLLSIRERIELLGGRMKIRSAAGKGSTFFIVVPEGEQVAVPPLSAVTVAQAGASGSQTRPSAFEVPPGPQAQNRLRVLLADDHAIVREGLRALLSEAHDIEVVGEAANGREAVDLAQRLRPDVIIMDVSMPLIEGHEATRQIKAYLPQTRVIALSMHDQSEKIEAMCRAGAERYVLKTAPSEELLAAIRGKEGTL
jgi:PAS domain S-box-containing protein